LTWAFALSSRTKQKRLFAVAAWKDAPYFTDAERAALALTEAVTRLSDRFDPVPSEIWKEATRHYNESALASLVLWIAMTNVWNRLNVATKQVGGEWAKSDEAREWSPGLNPVHPAVVLTEKHPHRRVHLSAMTGALRCLGAYHLTWLECALGKA
jgi:hypothetical protein